MVARLAASLLLALVAAGCPAPAPGPQEAAEADANGFTAPTAAVAEANAEVARTLPLSDERDFEEAKRGLVASDPDLAIAGPDGRFRTALSVTGNGRGYEITAVFLEKGEVRFSGPAAELAERDDLARAVFLGTEGG